MIQGQIHHISADEAQEDPEVVIGMFLVNDIPTIILFDSGASHSFASRSFVARNKFPCSLLEKVCWFNPRDPYSKAIWSAKVWKLISRSLFYNRFDSHRVCQVGCYFGNEVVDPIPSMHQLCNPRSHPDNSGRAIHKILHP